jgi:hypothetical protein
MISVLRNCDALKPRQLFFPGAGGCPGAIGWAQAIEHAAPAPRATGVADGAAVDDEPMGESRPFFRRQQPAEVLLNLVGMLFAG